VNIFQLSVKCRRIHPVCKSIDWVFKKTFKIFRINYIKLYKLIVKKTNYANKILLNIKNKINNIHYKLNVFKNIYYIRTMTELEDEEEEAGCSRDHTAKMGLHMYHHSVMSSS